MRFYTSVTALLIFVSSNFLAAAVISDVRIEQPLVVADGRYRGASSLSIIVTVATETDLEATISRAVAGRSELTPSGAFVGETLVVRTLPMQHLKPGTHTLTWDGLAADGKAITVFAVAPSEVGKPAPVPAVREFPVNRFLITVRAGAERAGAERAGAEQQSRSFVRIVDWYDPNRTIDTFCASDWAPDGSLVLADRPSWRGRRYTENWKLVNTIPSLTLGHESDPVECFGAQVDGKGNIYLLNSGGIYRYGPNHLPLEFSSREPQITFPYPQPVANRLGMRLDMSRGVYQRPSGDGQNVTVDTKALLGKPGFTDGRFNCFAVADDGTSILGSREPITKMWAFDSNGNYLREVTLLAPPSAATFGNGRFYVACENGIAMLDPKDFSQTKLIPGINARRVSIGRDGTVYAVNDNPSDMVVRFTADGEPKPFSAQTDPQLQHIAHQVRLSAEARKVPATAAEVAQVIQDVVGGRAGDFWISASIHGDTGFNHKRLLHYSAAGTYLPETTSIEVLERQPYQVFVEHTPAVMDLLVTDLAPRDGELIAKWSLTDFSGQEKTGSTKLVTRADRRQVLPLELPAVEFGHYRVALQVQREGQVVYENASTISRIRKPDMAVDPDSPFAMCWAVEPGLAGISGAKLERVGDTYWEKERTNAGAPGVVLPMEQVQPTPGHNDWWNSSQLGWRDAFTRWGMQVPGQFTYGEAWLGGSYPACRIFSYDAWLKWTLGTVDRLTPSKPPYYQFWNEPNFFWHVPGPFSREHFVLVAKMAWCAVKARDKEALSIPDGDAGSLSMMNELAAHGGARYNDAVQIHYPGVKPLQWDNMTAPEAPESKLDMVRDLIRLRDEQFPGKPVWNTEEGWWGAKERPWDVGAMALPRIYISQIAAGIEKIFWFDQVGMAGQGPDALLDVPSRSTYPTFAAYSQMTRSLAGASYVGPHDLGAGVFAQLFFRGDQAVLAIWSGKGPLVVKLELGAKTVVITDVIGRDSNVVLSGPLELPLTQFVQYVTFPRNTWATQIATVAAQARLQAAGCANVQALNPAIDAATGDAALGTLYRLIQAAEACALAGMVPEDAKRIPDLVSKTRAAVCAKEANFGYLRQSRLALSWAERLERSANRHGNSKNAKLQSDVLWAAQCAAQATKRLLTTEIPDLPGIAITSFVGEPGEIARIRGTVPVAGNLDTTIDEKFRLDVQRAAGETCELEITAWNLTAVDQHIIVVPRVPAGWIVTAPPLSAQVKPSEFLRVVVRVALPAGTAAGTYRVDATVTIDGLTAGGLHPGRITVK